MTGGIGLFAAFLGGLLALVSPCSALLLPSFFAYSFGSRAALLGRTLTFYLGLLTTLVPLGAAGSMAGRLLVGHRDLLITIGGVAVIVFGVLQILGRGFAPAFAQRAALRRIRADGGWGVFLLGSVYGLAGFCAGPILGSILTVAAMGGSPVRGAVLLAVYGLGMAAPLFVLALLWDRFELGRRSWLRGRVITLGRLHLHTTSTVSGLIFIALGVVLLLFDGAVVAPATLDVGTQFALEDRARALGSAITDSTVLLIVGAAALGIVAWRALSRGAAARATRAAVSDDEQDVR
ncbi:cytochrome c biogenesis CcdA family protein [Nocardia vermiculata]|uniref:Cytochrome c biogenesis protein CcdA n=1 Tax=Nocardia vermiculata TaxID=257274 RepID=A0A846Y2M4_9NOCA|nr:cytochrome c biogenesis CcdA family protein [Nocardia vermiculata]NKY53493.1 cytochrome c biogenesis protein CcdA [Nocardia vermiculata]